MEEAKRTIRETIDISNQNSSPLGRRLGILLYGPPGTGKTLLAKAIATHSGLAFLPVKGPEMLSQWVGETEANIRTLFHAAKEAAPCIVFFDELDSIGVERGRDGDSGGVTDRIVTQLMVEMDKVWEEDAQVFLIGATNRLDLLDSALLRPGRFEKIIHLRHTQSSDEQLAILKASLLKYRLDDDVCLEEVIKSLIGVDSISPADIAALANEAMKLAIRKKIHDIETGETDVNLRVSINQMDLLEAAGNRRR